MCASIVRPVTSREISASRSVNLVRMRKVIQDSVQLQARGKV